jgi:formylglycine-generating enzyme required for sulfatase activity
MAAAAIRHPNTVSVTDYGVLNGTMPYLVMEFVEGRSLHDILLEEKRLSPEQSVEIMLAVCAGVGAAHRAGVVHRDLKPLNIMLRDDTPPGEGVKVLDFGLAKIKSGELLGSFVAAQTQGMMGSPFYMAPEQWGDEEIDTRSDIYSLGVILYQMLAGDVPFKGKTIPSIMNKHLTTPPAPLSACGVEASEPLERAVGHALEKDPARRPQTVDEFVAELRAAMPELGGEVASRGVGAPTVPIGRVDTAWLNAHGLAEASEGESPDALKTVAGTSGSALEGESEHFGRATVAESSEALTEALTDEMRQSRGSNTARQKPAQTLGQAGGGADTRREEEERAAALRRAQEDERHRREAEELRRRESEESAAALAAQQASLAAQQNEAAQQDAVAQTPSPSAYVPGVAAPARSSVPFILLGAFVALALLACVGALAIYVIRQRGAANTNNANVLNANTNVNANSNVNVNSNVNADNANASHGGEQTQPDLVALAGGTFRIGRDDVPPLTDELMRERAAYLLWIYQQWPAHAVNVKPFAIDRNEVTNAEYAEFVKETRRDAPPPRDGDERFPEGVRARLPVGNVSFDDAVAFAAWRSKRDRATYRLPTEEEWEFAARGTSARLYPWEGSDVLGRAALDGIGIKPVGSFPRGATPEGVEDMLGNVWEWTTSAAAMYKGNDKTKLNGEDRGKVVVRGGSYESRLDGDEPITVTARRWVGKDTRSPVLGFRLVRVGR